MSEATVNKPVKPKVAKSTKAKSTATASPKKATSRKPGKTKSSTNGIKTEQRIQMIREEAYYRAESRGFVGGSPEQDWIEAEAEIARRLVG